MPPFGIREAMLALRDVGVLGAEAVREVPLRTYDRPLPAVVALDRGAGLELVVKVDRPASLVGVSRFHETYRDVPLVPALRYTDATYRFIAYDWVDGELGRGLDPPPNKASTMLDIAEGLLARYVPAETDEPGRLFAPWRPKDARRSWPWQAVLGFALNGRHDQVHAHLPEGARELVQRLASSPDRRGDGPLYLMHGDCGAHNFVFRDGALSAVIDPSPMAGEPIFELAFAFASWPHDLTLEAIMPAAEELHRVGRWRPPTRELERVLIEEVLIALYSRVGTFVVNRPADVPAYVAAWSYWTDLLARA